MKITSVQVEDLLVPGVVVYSLRLLLHVRSFLHRFYTVTYLSLYTVLEIAHLGLDKLAPELIGLLVKNASDTNKEQMKRGYGVGNSSLTLSGLLPCTRGKRAHRDSSQIIVSSPFRGNTGIQTQN